MKSKLASWVYESDMSRESAIHLDDNKISMLNPLY